MLTTTPARTIVRRQVVLLSVAVLLAHTLVVLASLGEVVTVGANLALATVVLLWAVRRGTTRAELGLRRDNLRRSLGVGLVVATLIAAVVALLAAVGVFEGQASPVGDPSSLAFRLLIGIPLGTALTEELLFRGVLLARWQQVVPAQLAVSATSAVFGLWHVAAEWQRVAGPGVLPAVVATGAASFFVLCPLRRWTDQLAAPVLVHAATNASVLLAVYLTSAA